MGLNLKKWLKGATRIRFDDRTLGNVLKNAGTVGGTIVGGPAGLALGAAGGIAGQAALGGNLRESLNAGLKGASNVGLAEAGKGVLSRALTHGPAGVPSPAVANGAASVPTGGLPMPNVPDLTTIAQPPIDPRGFLSRTLDAGKSTANWLGNHDKTASALLSTAGDVLDPTEEQLNREQARRLRLQSEADEYELQQRKARDAAMEPLRQALYGSLGSQIGNNYAQIAKNPYGGG